MDFNIPVVFLTAHADDKTLQRAKASGPFGYVLKPFEETELHTAIVMALQKHQSTVSERRRSREQLEESENRLKLALDAAQMGIWDWDLVTNRAILDERAHVLLGFEPGSFPGTSEAGFQRIHPEDLERVQKMLKDAIEQRSEYRAETRIVWPDGSIHWVLNRGRSYYDPLTNAPTRMLGVISEITERKKTEEALRRSESKYRRLADSNTIGIIVADFKGGIHEANDAFLEMIGYSRSDFDAGKVKWDEMTPPEHLQLDRDRIGEMFERGACTPYEKEYSKRDGSRVPVLIGYALLDEPKRDRAICFVVDLTERKKAEQKLQEAIRMRDEFISIASHELKTPVTSMKYQVEMMDRRLKRSGFSSIDPQRLNRLLEISTQQIHRLTRLVEDMLDISRIQIGTLKIEKKNFDLAQMVHEVVGQMSEQLKSARCPVEIQADSGLMGNWDRFRIEQVVTNLLTNAVKYAAGKPVRIQAKKEGDLAVLTVADQGRGIPKEAQERIFKRFERNVSASDTSGLGLGLYISNQIVERHGGRIRVESDVGRGATFRVELPLAS